MGYQKKLVDLQKKKKIMGYLGERSKDPKKSGGKWCQKLERPTCKWQLCANGQRRPQVLGLMDLGTSIWRNLHGMVCVPGTGGTVGRRSRRSKDQQLEGLVCVFCMCFERSRCQQQLEGSGCLWVCKRSKCWQLKRSVCVNISSVNLILCVCVCVHNSLANFKLD